MSALRQIAVGMTRAWVALYTRGLPAELRDARRSEIDSDLWEQGQVAALVEEPPGETAFQLTARLLLGIPSDLTWRVQAGLSAPSERSLRMNESLPMRGLVLAALAVAAFPLVIGILVLVGANGEMDGTERALFGPVQIAVGAMIFAGLLLSARRPLLGTGLVAAGAITISVLWYWFVVVTIPVGVTLVATAYARGRAATPVQPGPA
jgi:hypothetical protein